LSEAIAFPAGEDDLTAAWFGQALARRFPGVEVAGARIIQRIGGTALKLRFHLDYASATGPEGPPQTLWVKGGFETGAVNQGDAFVNEVLFYRDLAPRLGINLPDVYFGAVDAATNNGVILLEDLIARGASFGRADRPLSPDEAAATLAMQARYHARYWNDPALTAIPWLKAGGSIAGTGMVEQYFAGFWDAAGALPRFQWVTASQCDKDRLREALVGLSAGDAAGAHCLVHGDSHCANLFFDADGAPGYLDWQHVMRGHWAFDVANLLVTGLTVADRRAHERALLAGYRTALTAHGVAPPPFETMFDGYAAHALWSFMWAMCPVSAHPEEVCMLNTERACAAIEDLGSVALAETFT
jgi:hypothetical protein